MVHCIVDQLGGNSRLALDSNRILYHACRIFKVSVHICIQYILPIQNCREYVVGPSSPLFF